MVRLPESITAYIFDLDGVIFDSERAVLGEWKLVADKYGFTIDEETYRFFAFREKIGPSLFRDFL